MEGSKISPPKSIMYLLNMMTSKVTWRRQKCVTNYLNGQLYFCSAYSERNWFQFLRCVKKKIFKKANSLKTFQGHGRLLGVKSDKDLLTLTSDIGFRLKSKICLKNRYERKKTFFGHILLKFENDPSLTC